MVEYKKADKKVVDDITRGGKTIAADLEVDDRLYCTTKRDTFITLKDHKDQLMNNLKFRCIRVGFDEHQTWKKRKVFCQQIRIFKFPQRWISKCRPFAIEE